MLLLEKEKFKNILSGANQITDKLTPKMVQDCKNLLKNMKFLWELDNSLFKKNEISMCIYVVTSHLNTREDGNHGFINKYMKYIQAGAALTNQKLCEIRDNTGTNISESNPYYCELTAGYWISKNDCKHQWMGLCHYSRWLDVDDKCIENIIGNNVDVILPEPMYSRVEMVVRAGDVNEIIRKAILNVAPDYEDAMIKYYCGRIFFAGNILIAKKGIFIRYYEWLFCVLSEAEKISMKNSLVIGKRVWGYLGEHLTNIFFLKHDEYKIVCVPLYRNN